LRGAQERFDLVVGNVKEYAIFILDRAGRVATWNAGASIIKGYQADEITGKDVSVFYTPEDRALLKPQTLLAKALADGRVEDEGWRVRKDGSRFWADVVITPIVDPAGELEGFVKVTRDLTARKRDEDRLRQSERSLQTTLYSIGDGVLATDANGRVTRVNPVAARLTGWSETEAVGRPIGEVFHIINEETRAPAILPIARVLAEGVVVGLANHTALISRDGSEHPIADSGAPILNADGKTIGAVLVFRDVSEERRAGEALKQSEERLRLMISSVRDYALYMLDPMGRVASWNPGAELIKGYRADEIVGQHFSRFFTPEDVASGRPARELEIAQIRGRFEEEGWRVRKDGTRFWANVVITPIYDASNGLVGFAKITRDLTAQRSAQEERVRLAQAQEAIRLRDDFLSIASHELKTPLTALQLQLRSIRSQVGDGGGRLADTAVRATRVAERLANLIDALLDVSRIATGRLKLSVEPLDLVEVARDVIERLRESAVDAGCAVSLDSRGPIEGRWDRLRIEQVLTNLLSNALKYAARKPIVVSVARAGDEAVLQVRDDGPGIAEEQMPRLFERFERADSTRNYGGMGLGLYVAREIAQAHGGTIAADNLPGGGASFTVRLPLDSQATLSPA